MSVDPELDRLRSLTGAKWTWFDDDVLAAWVADMDLRPPAAATDAIEALLHRGDLGYNFAAAMRLPEVFAERMNVRFGWSPACADARLFCDVMQAVELALWLHTEPGDGVVLLTPVYPPFYKAIEACGCRLVDVPLDPGTWRLDPERLAASVDDTTRAILLCNPHNPTGRAFTADELAAIADVAERRDLLVISDEIWADLVYPGARHIPFASLSLEAENRTLTTYAASKAFNLAGLRCAIAHIGHPSIAEKIAEIPSHVFGAVGSPGAEATLGAWLDGDDWLEATTTHLQANRDHLLRRLAEEAPAIRVTSPQATYLAWLDMRESGLGDEPAEVLMEKARIALSRGLDFGEHGRGFARLNFATTRPILDEVIDRMVSAL